MKYTAKLMLSNLNLSYQQETQGKVFTNPLSPNINIHILLSIFRTFLMLLVGRIMCVLHVPQMLFNVLFARLGDKKQKQ